jgi:flagellar biosynthetic protein FlhB
MANGGGEGKTEKPTPRRIRKAREEGNVPKSTDLNSALVLIGGMGILTLLFGKLFNDLLSGSFYAVLNFFSPERLTAQDMLLLWGNYLKYTFLIVAGILIGTWVVAVLSNVIQFGFIFTLKPLKPDLSKLNPINGIKNLLFSLNALFELAKSIIKIALIVGVAYYYLDSNKEKIAILFKLPLWQGLELLGWLVFKLAAYLALVGLILALIDVAYRRWKYIEDLKMSKWELKEEYKQTEGNPEVKRELRKRMRQVMARRMMQEVPKATVVITNPTHYAVALKYNPQEDPAPIVVAKGVDNLAQKIIELAKQHGVEIFREPELARALYYAVDVGEPIPPKFYRAVAKILSYVLRKKRKRL